MKLNNRPSTRNAIDMYSLLLKKSSKKSNNLLGNTRLKLQPKWPPNKYSDKIGTIIQSL